jgi:ABC-2 type transport system permease protein
MSMKPFLVARQCWATATMSAGGIVGDNPLFALGYILRLVRVAVLLALWRIILQGRGPIDGLTIGSVLTYTLIAEVFSEPLTCQTELAWALHQGSVGPRFLWPMGIVGQFGSEAFGKWSFGLVIFSVPLLLASPLLGVNPAPASLAAFGLFLLSLALAVTVGLAIEFSFGALAVNVGQNVYVVDRVRGGLTALLSGAALPLALYPWGLGNVFGLLPFASVASAPLRIYTGTGDAATLLAVQAFWAITLWPLTGWLWRVNRQKLVIPGG